MKLLSLLASALLLELAAFPAEAAGIRIAGTVAGPDGRALAQARVDLAPLPANHGWGSAVLSGRAAPEPVRTTATDSAGSFALEAPTAGVWTVLVQAEGFVPMRLAPFPLVEATVLPPVLLPRDAGAIVQVRDGGGAARAGAWISAETASEALWRELLLEGWRPAARITVSDAQGLASLPRLAGERLAILAALPGSIAQTRAEGMDRTVLTLGGTSPCRTLEVRSENGGPLAEVMVAVGKTSWPVGTTDQEGRVGLCGALSQPIDLHLFAAGGGRHIRPLEPGGADGAPVIATLPRPAHITGRVLVSGGRPLAGALVWPMEDPGRFVSTDVAGIYRIEVTRGAPARLQVAAPGFLPKGIQIRLAAEDETRSPTVILESEVTASGQVVDRKGTPLAGVLVEAIALLPARGSSRSVTDSRGRFSLHGLRLQDSYEVTALRDGFSRAVTTLEVAALGRQGMRVVLTPARPAHGRITDGAGRPLEGAEVKLLFASSAAPPSAPLATAWTDRQGRFALPPVPIPRFGVTVRSRGFVPLKLPQVKVPPGEGPFDLGTLVLRPGSTLTGRVTNEQGEPIPEAGIWVLEAVTPLPEPAGRQARREPPQAVADRAGLFRLDDLARGRRVHLSVHRPGYLPRLVAAVDPPSPAPLEIVLEPAARVAGEILEEGSARPVARARVTLRSQGPLPGTVGIRPPVPSTSSAVADDQGRFVIEDVAAGRVELEAFAEGFVRSVPVELDIPLGGAAVDGVRLQLRRGARVQGFVRRASGEPVMGATLRITGEEAISDADGFYQVTGVRPGNHELSAFHPELERLVRRVNVAPGINQEDLVLTGGWRVSGRVIDERKDPILGARITLRAEVGLERRKYETASRDDGTFDFPGVVAGTYEILALRAGYATVEQRERLQVADGAVDGLEIVLPQGISVTGRLLGLEPEDLTTVEVEASQGEKALRAGTVDSLGGYEITDLGPGVWSIRALAREGVRQAEARVTIEREARSLTRDLDFSGTLALSGRVSYDRIALPETSVSVLGLDLAVSRSVITDHLGTFRIEDLEPGRYRISVANRDMMVSHNEEIELLADRDLDIEIATARVQGTVLSSVASEPLPNALVSALQVLGPEGTAASLTTVATDRNGAFSLARLATGTYRLSVRKDGYEPMERLLTVETGANHDLELKLAPTQGLELAVRFASGRFPSRITLNVLDSSGKAILTETRPAAGDRLHRFRTVPTGHWILVVSAPEAVPAWRTVEVPGPPLEVVLTEAAQIEVRIPDLLAENLIATLTAKALDGRPFIGVGPDGRLERQWTIRGGIGSVPGLPAGTWTIVVQAANQRTWQRTVTVTAGASLVLTFQ